MSGRNSFSPLEEKSGTHSDKPFARNFFNYVFIGNNLTLELSCLNPQQALLIYIIDEDLYRRVFSEVKKELGTDTFLLLSPSQIEEIIGSRSNPYSEDPNLLNRQILKNIVNDHIIKGLESPYRGGGVQEGLKRGLRYFYRAAYYVKHQGGYGNLPLPDDAELVLPEDPLGPLEIPLDKTDKQIRIAQMLAYIYYQKYSLSLEDVISTLEKYLTGEEIKNINQTFLTELGNQEIDERHYPLSWLFPHQFFLQQALVAMQREFDLSAYPNHYLNEIFYHAVVQLRKTVEDNSSLRQQLNGPINKLIKDAQWVKKNSPSDLALATQILIKVNNLIQKKDADLSKEISALQNKSWGKLMLGTLLAITSVTLIALCCASSAGAAIPFLALGLSVYIPTLTTGIVGALVSFGLFNSALNSSSQQGAKLLTEDVDKITQRVKSSH